MNAPPPDEPVRLRLAPARADALDRLWKVLGDARVVGGAVRDAMIGAPVADVDLATPDPPARVAALLDAAGIKVVPTGLAHGTVTGVADGIPFEITTLRRDLAADGRHATVAFTIDWRADAARRDFTFNAMSLDRDGRVHDYFGGVDDLAACRVRFVGDPALRIAEDHLRVLRFFRFLARFGAGGVADPAALRAIGDGGGASLTALSAERVWSELKRLLGTAAPATAIRVMRDTGVLGALFGRDVTPERLDRLLATEAPSVPLLRLTALTSEAPGLLARRLRLSGAEAARLAGAAAPLELSPEADDASLRRALADTALVALLDRTYLAGADDAPARGAAWAGLRARLRALAPPVFPLAGRDALALGATPGPAVGAALARTREWWLARGTVDGRDACLARLAVELAPPSSPMT